MSKSPQYRDVYIQHNINVEGSDVLEAISRKFYPYTREIDSIISLVKVRGSQSGKLNFADELSNEGAREKDITTCKSEYTDVVEVMRMIIDNKDPYTRAHSDRVAYYSQAIGRAFNLSEEELELLRLAGIFHDIGKVSTSSEILLKGECLNATEYAEVKKHSLCGADLLSAISLFNDVVPLIKYHHERIDGKGYPDGLKEDEIPFLVKILSVADAFDAMTSDRKYKSKLNIEEAKSQLLKAAGTQFDPDVVRKFIVILDTDYDEIQNDIRKISCRES